MKLHGAKELQRALEQLPRRVGKAAIRRALKKAGQPIADDAAKRVAGVKPGLAAHGISVSTKLSRRQRRGVKSDRDRIDMYIGAHSASRGLAHLIEFGTGPRHHKSGKSTGAMPAQPYMRPAWESGKQQAFVTLGKELWIEIDKTARRLAKRQAKAAKAGR